MYGGYGGGYDDHGESVYQIIPPRHVEQERPQRHQSKHSGVVPPSGSTFHTQGTTLPPISNITGLCFDKPVGDYSARSMGSAPGSARNHPGLFIKKGTKHQKVLSLEELRRTNPDQLKPSVMSARTKPPVPRHMERPVCNLVTSKNFLVANAVDAILAQPKTRPEVSKDYLNKEDFGKAPKYLAHIKQDIAEEMSYIRELQQQRDDQAKSLVQPLEENERLGLIEGLKAKWEQVNTEYQATTHLTKLDTIGKTKRKERYEAELGQIEKDIERLNRRNILVNSMW